MMDKSTAIIKRLNQLGMTARADICGRDCTSFKIGGRIGVFFEPASWEELKCGIDIADETGYRYFVIGKGSNLLIPDEGVDAMLIKPRGALAEFEIVGERLLAGAGASLAAVAKASVKAGLAGLEWAAGIPGTVGGAVAMNAGAYGGEIKNVIKRVEILKDGAPQWREVADDDMSYRRSRFSYPEELVLQAEFELSADDGHAAERMRDHNEKRRAKQPVELPSAGSTFKRPEGYFAAALIEDAGLKGLSVGGACVSPKHAGFIVNTGGATCADVLALMDKVRECVYNKFGVMLEPEIRLIK